MKPKFIKGEDDNQNEVLININNINFIYPPDEDEDDIIQVFLCGDNESYYIKKTIYNKLKKDYALTIT